MATATAKRKREYIPYVLTEQDRERLKSRCPRCKAMVVLPCYACWLERYVARNEVFDPRDPSPHKHDRVQITHLPKHWKNERVTAVWNSIIMGSSITDIARHHRMSPTLAAILRTEMLEHLEKHPELVRRTQ